MSKGHSIEHWHYITLLPKAAKQNPWPVTSLRFPPNLRMQPRVGRPFLAARRLSSRRQRIPQPTVTACLIRHRRRLG